MGVEFNLQIAGISIHIQSDFAIMKFDRKRERFYPFNLLNNLSSRRKKKPDILIKVMLTKNLPQFNNTKLVFSSNFSDDTGNLYIFKKGKSYIYIHKQALKDKNRFMGYREKMMLTNKTYSRATVYLLPRQRTAWVWHINDIIGSFLQILLMNYLTLKKDGIFIHSAGIKNPDGCGLLFAGKSGAGKTTLAHFFYKYTKAVVLNDDRIIVRKINRQFFIYSSPWYGEFDSYHTSKIKPVPLKKIFFIYKMKKNVIRKKSPKEAFALLYSLIFPPFWDRRCLVNLSYLTQDLVKNIPCFILGLRKNKKVIEMIYKREISE
jgi:hypothetical protein